jgi:DNA-binding response OmpR family regulator
LDERRFNFNQIESYSAYPKEKNDNGGVLMTTILIADDNPTFRRVVGVHMAAAGFDFIECGTGAETIAAIETMAPELVLLDHMMPQGDGPSVLRHVRKTHPENRVPIIMLTARCGGDDKVRAFEDGADDYVVKPFHGGELTLRVKRLLDRKKQ